MRLLILSCAGKKTADIEPVAAIDRYLSPAYFVVRKFIRENPDAIRNSAVWIVSAKYGVIDSALRIPSYDRELTVMRRNSLRRTVIRQIQQLQAKNFTNTFPREIFCFLPDLYYSLVEDYIAHTPERTAARRAHGAPGQKLKMLKTWLNQSEGDEKC